MASLGLNDFILSILLPTEGNYIFVQKLVILGMGSYPKPNDFLIAGVENSQCPPPNANSNRPYLLFGLYLLKFQTRMKRVLLPKFIVLLCRFLDSLGQIQK
jgi:hypothetical protein